MVTQVCLYVQVLGVASIVLFLILQVLLKKGAVTGQTMRCEPFCAFGLTDAFDSA